jgi:hypothetical protein
MRWKLLSGAVLGLGISLATPTFAKADHLRDDHRTTIIRHDDRRDVRREVIVDRRPIIERARVIVTPAPVIVTADIDTPVLMSNVPGVVTNTLYAEGYTGPIEAVQLVQRDGQAFYRFRADTARGCFDVRIGTNGSFLGVAAAL